MRRKLNIAIELTAIFTLLLYFALSQSLIDVPLCPLAYFGQVCPTCGTTRSLWHILHGNFSAAWALNPIGYLVLLVLVRRLFVLALSGRKQIAWLQYEGVNLCLLGAFLTGGTLRVCGWI